MPTANLANVTTADTDWEDLVATHAGLASVNVRIQNLRDDDLLVYFGGVSAPTGTPGFRVKPYGFIEGNAAKIWVKPFKGGKATVAVATI